ncbi:hypothetical protein VNO80_12249 [Phaseolus coccineus]|uniref:Uncharacterized protein n=1 Tax=Phaseolus coccineus TaxID=3886 RepID=A0AAN9RAM3_PHACN
MFPSGFANLVQAGSNEFLVQSHCNCTGIFLRSCLVFFLYYIMLVVSDIKAEISIRRGLFPIILLFVPYILFAFAFWYSRYACNFK